MLAEISRAYYFESKSKVDIAREYGLSRFHVARLLDEARELGVVRIDIGVPDDAGGIDVPALKERLGLRKLVIVPSGTDDMQAREHLARAAAQELASATRAGSTIGISWSRTLDLAARHVSALPRCEVVQLAGALPVLGSGNSLELIQRLGQLSGGRTWPIWAPLVVENSAIAESLRNQVEISGALTKADSLDVAVVAVGAWSPGLSTVWDRVDNALRLEATEAGAVAECSGRLISGDGVPVATDLDHRVLAVSLEQLRRTPEVVAICQGSARVGAALGAIRAGIISTLITDQALVTAMARQLARDEMPDGASQVGGRAE
jgi:DNA-binding transcriptional regulator LsrR (DeoR family)